MDISQFDEIIRSDISEKEKLDLFEGTCEKDGEPDYELLRKHIEQWFQRHPEEGKRFVEYNMAVREALDKDTGASRLETTRHAANIPQGLYAVLSILSPNFIGQKELSAEAQKKKLRTFLKKFPVFRTPKKL